MTRFASHARHTAFAAAVCALMGAASPALAINAVCEVLPTSDGFAALRAGPSADARMIARMKTGHSVHLRARNQGEVIRSGPWTQVIYWPNGELFTPGQPEFRSGKIGWVAQRLIGDCG
jgi:hypothetical protein